MNQSQVLGELGLIFAMSEDGRKLLATYTPVEGVVPIDLATIKAVISSQGFGKLFQFDPALQKLAGQCGKVQEAFTVEVAEVRDAQLQIDLAPDKMTAYLNTTRAYGGKAINRDQIANALNEKKITHGILHDEIARAINEHEVSKWVIAEGRKPINGEDGKLQALVDLGKERRPRFDANGVANYRELGGVITVHEGERLMQKIPPTAGEPGLNVLGQAIPAKAGKAMQFGSQLKGAKLDPEDPNFLVAAISGQPIATGSGMSVEPSITIGTVDLASGNVDFDGNIVVNGDVQPNMCIYASGDIQVGGTVEAATLEAGGNIVVKGGIIGHSDMLQTTAVHVRCGGTCSALFIENARIEAGDSIQVEKLVRQSDLSAANQIVVGRPGSGQGSIIGGSTRATLLVQAGIVGTPVGVKTHIMVGSNPKLQERVNNLNKEMAQKAKELDDIVKILTFLAENPTRAKPGMQQKAENTRAQLLQELDSLRMEKDDLGQALKLADGARFVVEKTLYTNVKIEIGDKIKQEDIEREAGIYVLKEGEIERI